MGGEHMRRLIAVRLLVFLSLVTVTLGQIHSNVQYEVKYTSNDIDCGDLQRILDVTTWKFEVTVRTERVYFPVTLGWYEGNKVVKILGKVSIGMAFGGETSKEQKGTVLVALQPLDGGTLGTAPRLRLSCTGFRSPSGSFVFDNPFRKSRGGVVILGSSERIDDLTFKLMQSEDRNGNLRIRLDLDAWEGKHAQKGNTLR
jgi:hypothetical protein